MTTTIFTLSACGGRSAFNIVDKVDALANQNGFYKQYIVSDPFNLLVYHNIKLTRAGKPLTIYIEGDGKAWRSKHTISSDPTPTSSMLLQMAMSEGLRRLKSGNSSPQAGDTVYLARPCQYITNGSFLNSCPRKYWTSHRFSPEVISSMNEAINRLKERSQATGIHLVGYSGGGAVATLIAANRDDVFSLRTIAGNLNHTALNKHHKVTSMKKSLDAIDITDKVSHIPQMHYMGAEDTTVPPFIIQSFVSKAQKPCVKSQLVPNVSHNHGWLEFWESAGSKIPSC